MKKLMAFVAIVALGISLLNNLSGSVSKGASQMPIGPTIIAYDK